MRGDKNQIFRTLDGPNCERLLNSIDCAENPLSAFVPDKFQEFVVCLRAFKLVKHCCFGKELRTGWNVHINDFEVSYRKLGISVTPKVHNVFYETKLFIQKTGKPIGLRSEQKFESVHHDMKSTWSWYKRMEGHKDYEEALTAATVNYNSFHLDLLFDEENPNFRPKSEQF